MRVGAFDVRLISGGAFRLDGGGMFGVVPRALWARTHPPDDAGRIPLEAGCLLIRGDDRVVLVETGYGSKLTTKERGHFDLRDGNPLFEHLAAENCAPTDVTDVVLTHLHMDHCGGATIRVGEEVVPAFPRARVYVQRREWGDALSNRSHMRISYREENLAPLAASERLSLLDGDATIMPGLDVRVTGGHTRAHQCVLLRSESEGLLFPGDICPTAAHLRPTWTMSYDMDPYGSVLARRRWLTLAALEGWTVAFGHEPIRRAVRLRRDGDQLEAEDVDWE